MFDYEAAKQQFGAARARQMQQEASNPQAAAIPAAPQPAAAPWGGGYSSPQDLASFQSWYGQQQGGSRPEDMERFLQTDTLARWNPYLITSGPSAGKYRSMRGAEGVFDKPQECPPGMVPSGPNETDPCIGGGGQTAPQVQSQPQWGAPAAPQGMGLQGMMAQLQPQVSGAPVSQPQPLQAAIQPFQSALETTLKPQGLQGATRAIGGQTQNQGWSSTGGGLQNMLAPLQKRNNARVGSWF